MHKYGGQKTVAKAKTNLYKTPMRHKKNPETVQSKTEKDRGKRCTR